MHYAYALRRDMLTLYVLNFQREHNIYLHFVSFLHVDTTQEVEILPQKDKNLPNLHSQYHGWWCPGDVRSQDISSHDIDIVKPR